MVYTSQLGWVPITGFTATPASTSTITMSKDRSAVLIPGTALRYTIGGTTYYGIITAITSTLITLAGAPLSGTITALFFSQDLGRVIQMPILIPGYYEDATDATLLANDLGQTLLWQQGSSHCVRMAMKTRVADSSSNGVAQAYIGGSALSTSGLTLAGTGWYYTVVDINTTNYKCDFGEDIEIGATKGTGGTAQDLSVLLTFVVA